MSLIISFCFIIKKLIVKREIVSLLHTLSTQKKRRNKAVFEYFKVQKIFNSTLQKFPAKFLRKKSAIIKFELYHFASFAFNSF